MGATRPTAISNRLYAGIAIALLAGIGIGYVDSRPGWDDSGISAFVLVAAAGIAAYVAGRVPWLIALATGLWIPLLEIRSLWAAGPLLALAFASLGAALGWVASRR